MTPCQQALRAAHTRHNGQLTYTFEATRTGMIKRRWAVGNDSVAIITAKDEPGAFVKIFVGESVFTGHTSDTQPVLDLLAALGLAPIRLSCGYTAALATVRAVDRP